MPVFTRQSGLHVSRIRHQTRRRNIRSQGARMGPAQHGLRAAETRLQPQVPDPLHTNLPQRRRVRAEQYRGQGGGGVSGPEPRGAEEEVCL